MITIDYDLYTNECRNKYERKMYEIFARNTNEIRKKYEGHTNEIHLKYERNTFEIRTKCERIQTE